MIRKILTCPNPILYQKSVPVVEGEASLKENIQEVKQMYATLNEIKSHLKDRSSNYKTFSIKDFEKEFLNGLFFLQGDK